MAVGVRLPSTGDLALCLVAREDLTVEGELDFGEEADLGFLLFCFLGGLATSEVLFVSL